ncbi:MAG TPA: chemotaxis protein CheB [Azospirillaceae bacterium]|nr:chemotaxis protein CheB [Azospirillaceae bacterium]
MKPFRYDAVMVGCSLGGLRALRAILQPLPADYPLPVIVVSHIGPDGQGLLAELLDEDCAMSVVEVEDKAPVVPGIIHVAPGGYHLLIEGDRTFSLSVDAKVRNVRPAIDVLFESAVDTYGGRLVGVVLTGANDDGAQGLKAIREAGGFGIVQDPATAEAATMPKAAFALAGADRVLALEDIALVLQSVIHPEPTP